MPFAIGAAGAGAVGSIVGGGKQANATKQAAQTQASAANNATDLQRDQFNTAQQNELPFLRTGSMAAGWLQDDLANLTVNGGGFNPAIANLPQTFSYNPSDFENDPAFQSSMKFGQQAMERSAASKGGLLGGAEQKSLNQFGTDTANQYYNQDYSRAQDTYEKNYSTAFNTFTANRDNIFNKLSSVAGLGLNAATGTNAAGMNFANNASDIALGAGNSAAAGIIGSANAGASAAGGVSSSLSSLLSSPSFQNLLQKNSASNNNASSYAKNANYDYSSES